ncbi:MAG: carbohydrate kinase, YjeF related protein [Deltaproteobacteria bacterium]|nr:carbohydrate kinase, YjeF related protein [Deltaproteobacteria bacterium]
MKVLSPQRMAKYDKYAIETWGIPSAVLMENAGRNTYRLMKENYLDGRENIAIVCGRGNNGGDGFVIGRYALIDNFGVCVYLVGRKTDLKGDAALNMSLFESLSGEIVELTGPSERFEIGLKHADIIVDAIFGTGLSKPVGGIEEIVIGAINASGKTVISVDIPSGIDGNTGKVLGSAVRAHHTFTYAYPKLGQIMSPGSEHAGRLTVIDISIPPFVEAEAGYDGQVTDGEMIRSFLKKRNGSSHKGSFGHAIVIAGSPGKTGAAHMASLAALKIGAGLVTLIIPETLNPILEMKTTEVMTYPVKDDGKGLFIPDSFDDIASFAHDKDVIIMGPGLSQNDGVTKLVRKIYAEIDKPFVIDADGINAFQGCTDVLKNIERQTVLTPHPGELARLIGKTAKEVNAGRIDIARLVAAEWGINILLKGAASVLAASDGGIFLNPTGNPSLAKGGSGDILTGFIGGLASQGYTLVESTLLGAYLHGYMADTWVEDNSDMDLLALDLITGLGRAIEEIRNGTDRIYIERSL